MNTQRYPYTHEPNHHLRYGIGTIGEHELDGLTVFLSTTPGDTIVAYPNIVSAETAFGVTGTRAALLWELIRDNPNTEILVKVN